MDATSFVAAVKAGVVARFIGDGSGWRTSADVPGLLLRAPIVLASAKRRAVAFEHVHLSPARVDGCVQHIYRELREDVLAGFVDGHVSTLLAGADGDGEHHNVHFYYMTYQ